MTRQRLAEDLVKIARALDLASAALSRLAVEVLEEEPSSGALCALSDGASAHARPDAAGDAPRGPEGRP